jgi:hypothetical protein
MVILVTIPSVVGVGALSSFFLPICIFFLKVSTINTYCFCNNDENNRKRRECLRKKRQF